MTAKRRNRETERLSIRCTKREKHMIEKYAEEKKLSLTQCTKELYRSGIQSLRRDKSIASAACRMQDLVNYMREHYIEDDYISEEGDKIWDELS